MVMAISLGVFLLSLLVGIAIGGVLFFVLDIAIGLALAGFAFMIVSSLYRYLKFFRKQVTCGKCGHTWYEGSPE